MKILNIYFCYLRVALYVDRYGRGTNFAWEMDSFSRRRLKYNFLARKLRTLVCKFHDSTGDYSDIRMIRMNQGIESVFPFNGIERKKGRNLIFDQNFMINR